MTTRATTTRLNAADRHLVRTITSRLHVGTPEAEVVAHLAIRLKWTRTPKALRKAAYRYALQCHRDNRTLYLAATGRI